MRRVELARTKELQASKVMRQQKISTRVSIALKRNEFEMDIMIQNHKLEITITPSVLWYKEED